MYHDTIYVFENFASIVFQSLETLDNGKPFLDAYNADLALVVKCYRYMYIYI